MREPRKWIKLDNAAKIYPAASTKKWSALFRLSMTLDGPVDPFVLQTALEGLRDCYPAFFMRLRRGVFWYYMEETEGSPRVREDGPCPCLPLRPKENGGFCFRVLYYGSRIAVEYFHVLTDGTGGMRFLKTLVAEYLKLCHGADIPREQGLDDPQEPPDPGQMEDAFLRYAGDVHHGRAESSAYHLTGTPEKDFVHLTCGMMPAAVLKQKAGEKGVSITTYLCAAMILAADALQAETCRARLRRKPVKVSLPVNLRRFFPSVTLRNFSSYVNPGIDPRLGEHTFDEVLQAVHHHMGAEATAKQLGAKFTANVRSERNAALRVAPLFLKNAVMSMVFLHAGDKKTTTTISNLGLVSLPPEMEPYVRRVELILGPLKRNPVACAVATYGGTLYFNVTSTIREPRLERAFFTRLVTLGVPVKVESNQRKG